MKFATTILLRLILLVAWCRPVGALEASQPLQLGDHELSLRHGDRDRSYIVHVPPGADKLKRLPLVLNFHGGGGRAKTQKDYSRMDGLADKEGFLVVYPNGTGGLAGRLLTWNAGTCCGYALDNKVDDVGFVLALLRHLEGFVPIDRDRIYATGLSNGAMMAYRLAVEASEQIAAIAPVAGGMVVERTTASRPVPVMHFHSVDDRRALYRGGLGPPFPMTNRRVPHPDIERVIAQWASHNGCPSEPTISAELKGREGSPKSNHRAIKYVHGPCREGTEVALWKMSGAGHVWPGGLPDYLPRLLGPSTDIVDANVEMWKFFSRFKLKGHE